MIPTVDPLPTTEVRTSVTPVLDVRDLTTEIFTRQGAVRVVDGVSFAVGEGQTLGIVGESGCGKSLTLLSVLGLIPPHVGTARADGVLLDGRDLLTLPEEGRRAIRGNDMTLIAQDPMVALNPLITIGSQVADVLMAHQPDLTKRDRARRAVELLDRVGIPDAAARARQHPHEFSGGMLQRVMIAMAIANDPRLILADEPTTALDVTIQAQILDLLREMQQDRGMSLVLVTHDLGVVAQVVDRVVVMYAGRVVETGPVHELFTAPRHPYTAGLLASLPSGQTRGKQLWSVPGQPPSPAARPGGCAFHPRCAIGRARERCRTEAPALAAEGGRSVACHFPDEVAVVVEGRASC